MTKAPASEPRQRVLWLAVIERSEGPNEPSVQVSDVVDLTPAAPDAYWLPVGARSEARAFATWVRGRIVEATGADDWWVGVGAAPPKDTGRGRRDGRDAIDCARSLGYPPGVVLLEDVWIALALGSNERACAALRGVIQPIVARDERTPGSQLVPTLEAWFASELSVVKTATVLGIHRHTVEYRLKQIERMLRRSVRRQPDSRIIEAALVALRLTGSSAER